MRGAVVGAAAVGIIVAVGGGIAAMLVLGLGGSTAGPESQAAVLPALTDDEIRVVLDDGAELSTDTTIDVDVTSSTGADEVQISVDPTFADATWGPLAGDHALSIYDGGYQIVFARVRTGDSGAPGATGVAGIEIDTTWVAATASAEGGPHRASWVRLAAPDVLVVRVETGRVRWNGDAPDDLVLGRPLDLGPLVDVSGFHLGPDDPVIVGVSRVSRPLGQATFGDQRVMPMVHDFSLQLDRPVALGVAMELTVEGVEPASFTIDDTATVSPAVHVNQLGFRPGDDGKVALVSSWRGAAGGIAYPDSMTFEVIDATTGGTVMTGLTTRRPASGNEYGKGDLTGAEVHEADFSSIADPGRYRVCVAAIGCSENFAVSDAGTWRRAALTVARAAYHQRSGTALGQPYTPIERPRPFHPDDGVVFHQTTLTMIDDPTAIGRDDRFDEYASSTDEGTVTDAWGGHFDAGDWNARIQHLAELAVALDLVELYPEVYGSLDVNIPESGNAIPDLLDEGLWDLDLFRRLQRDDGGVPGNVDQARFGNDDETSWRNTIDVYVYAPDVWSTYQYAAVAAHAAVVLRAYDPAVADGYARSAGRAMDWAETTWAVATPSPELELEVDEQRAVAAAAMLGLTGDTSWNEIFAAASSLDDGPLDLLDCDGPQCSAAWIYSRLDPALVRPQWQANATESLRRNAEAALAGAASTSFAWVMERPDIPVVWGRGPSIPHGVGLLRAFVVTGDVRYRTAMVRAASFSLGGNPLDTSFATGLGANPARFALIGDSIKGGLPVWPGTFQYGIHDLSFSADDDWVEEFVLGPAGVEPAAADVPLLQRWFDVGTLPMMNEFTFSESHAVALWTLGVLGAT